MQLGVPVPRMAIFPRAARNLLHTYFGQYLCKSNEHTVGRDSSVGIATCYGLDGPG